VVVNAGETFERTLTMTANLAQRNITVAVITVDMNGDGIINAKDYAYIQKMDEGEQKTKYAYIFGNLLNADENTVQYQ